MAMRNTVRSGATAATVSPPAESSADTHTMALRRPVRSEIQPKRIVVTMLVSVKAISTVAKTPDACSLGTSSRSMMKKRRYADTVKIDIVTRRRHAHAQKKSRYLAGFSQYVDSTSDHVHGAGLSVRTMSCRRKNSSTQKAVPITPGTMNQVHC